MAQGRNPSRNVSFIKPSEPSFLKNFKAKVKYKEPDTVDTKKKQLEKDDKGDNRYIEDELPTVVMEGSSATEEEYKEYMKEQSKTVPVTKSPSSSDTPITPSSSTDTTSQPSLDNVRIVFKRPKKRTSSEADDGGGNSSSSKGTGGLFSSTKRKPLSINTSGGTGTGSRRRRSSSSERGGGGATVSPRMVKNTNLLSFDDDDN